MDGQDPIIDKIIVGLIVLLLGTLVLFLVKRFGKLSGKVFGSMRQRQWIKSGLQSYKLDLEEKTLNIRHPWMKEDQKFKDILIPIIFELNGNVNRENLEIYIKNIFSRPETPRLLILGKPGSGKSIAMRVISCHIWNVISDDTLIPVLLNFRDIKDTRDESSLVTKIVEKFRYYQFKMPKRKKETIEEFVNKNLYDGKIVLLFDGYDELERITRRDVADFLNHFMGVHRQIPVIISSRTALYENERAFDSVVTGQVNMAPLDPLAILRFLAQWKFDGDKSANELFDMINGKAHLSELAGNPLMLTIIAFLYSLPKYILPDNRVQFYERCTRALLEEWDTSKQISRANRYEAHQKMAVLSSLAYEQVKILAEGDDLIDQAELHRITRKELERLGLKAEDYAQMRDEIAMNSGLLQFIPPSDYRFPHRTFMEYFAACYLNKEKSYDDMLKLFESDPNRWKEVLLLYLGLLENKEHSRKILEYLRDSFKLALNDGKNNSLVFSALTQSAVPDPSLASEILDLASQSLPSCNAATEVIEELGYIAANLNWAHAEKAKKILKGLIPQKLDNVLFQQIIIALLHAKDYSLNNIILKNWKRMNFESLFSMANFSGKSSLMHKLLSLNIPNNKKEEIIEGLAGAGKISVLCSLLINTSDAFISQKAAFELYKMSELPNFYETLDEVEFFILDLSITKIIEEKYRIWGWSWDAPRTEVGKKLAILICYQTTELIYNNKMSRVKLPTFTGIVANFRLNFLVSCFLKEFGESDLAARSIGLHSGHQISIKAMKKHWRGRVNINSLWYKFLGWQKSDTIIIIGLLVYLIPSLAGIVGIIMMVLGKTNNIFFTYMYSSFSVYFLFGQFLIFGLILSSLLAIYDESESKGLISLAGIAGYWGLIMVLCKHDSAVRISLKLRKFFTYIAFILSLLIWGVPLHHLYFNGILFCSLFAEALYLSDYYHIDFAFVHPEYVMKIARQLRGEKIDILETL